MVDYIVSACYPSHPAFKSTFHGLFTRKAKEWAVGIGRELAYGPPILHFNEGCYEPVLLWPLVVEEGDGDLSR